jgi:hypothetical protein
MSEPRAEYKAGCTDMIYKGGDTTPEIRAVYAEFGYVCYTMAVEIVRLRAENETIKKQLQHLIDEVNRG